MFHATINFKNMRNLLYGIAIVCTFVGNEFKRIINDLNEMKKKTITVCATLAAMMAYPMSALAGSPDMGTTVNDDIPIIVHGPHRAPRITPAVIVEYNENAGTVKVTFTQAVNDVGVLVCENGVGVMDYFIGDAAAGNEYVVTLDLMDSTEERVLYFVSAGTVFSVYPLN